MLGKIYLDNKNITIIFAELLKNGEKRVFDLDSKPNDICSEDDQIIISDRDEKCLKIYDKDLNFIRKIDRINGEEFQPTGILANFEKKTILHLWLF